jgi:hypothetical protein
LRVGKVGAGITICGVHRIGFHIEIGTFLEPAANARLITAAPDLLQSCMALLAICQVSDEMGILQEVSMGVWLAALKATTP